MGTVTYDGRNKCSKCGNPLDEMKGIKVCRICKIACIDQNDKHMQARLRENVENIEQLSLQKSNCLHSILQKSLDKKELTKDEKDCAKLCVNLVFEIKPEVKHWLDAGQLLPGCAESVYQLLNEEDKLCNALNKLEDNH